MIHESVFPFRGNGMEQVREKISRACFFSSRIRIRKPFKSGKNFSQKRIFFSFFNLYFPVQGISYWHCQGNGIPSRTAQWCNGSTTDSGSVCRGSNPCWAAIFPDIFSAQDLHIRTGFFCGFLHPSGLPVKKRRSKKWKPGLETEKQGETGCAE